MKTPDEYKELSKTVRVKLFSKGKTVKWGAEKLEVSRQYLHNVFNGRDRRVDLLQKLNGILEDIEDAVFSYAA